MTETWLPRADKLDYRYANGRGGMNGAFAPGRPIGVAVHVNVSGKTSNGTSNSYFRDNPGQVLPNFQVFRDGTISQFTPMEWQSWCQVNGNGTFAAIECGGDPDMPYTKEQIDSIGYLLSEYHKRFNIPLVITNSPSRGGVGTHSMGGTAWGGHACPGDLRAGQRKVLIAKAREYLKPRPPKFRHTYKQGDKGPSVRALQQKLINLGYVKNPTSNWVDGFYGPQTTAAVVNAKRELKWFNHGGNVGKLFWHRLFAKKKK